MRGGVSFAPQHGGAPPKTLTHNANFPAQESPPGLLAGPERRVRHRAEHCRFRAKTSLRRPHLASGPGRPGESREISSAPWNPRAAPAFLSPNAHGRRNHEERASLAGRHTDPADHHRQSRRLALVPPCPGRQIGDPEAPRPAISTQEKPLPSPGAAFLFFASRDVVTPAGLEPARLAAADFKSDASTNSAKGSRPAWAMKPRGASSVASGAWARQTALRARTSRSSAGVRMRPVRAYWALS